MKELGALDITIPVMRQVLKRAGIERGVIEDVIWRCNYEASRRLKRGLDLIRGRQDARV